MIGTARLKRHRRRSESLRFAMQREQQSLPRLKGDRSGISQLVNETRLLDGPKAVFLEMDNQAVG